MTASSQKAPPISLRRRLTDHAMTGVAVLTVILVLAPLIAIFGYLMYRGIGSINWAFLTQTPKPVGEAGGGMANAIVGSAFILGIASLIGVRTTLMRPPYAIDEEPDTADQVRPLEIPQEMGYITVGNRIDPNDWSDSPHRSAEQISAYVLAHLPPCRPDDLRCGNIVLMHDGGGDRSETVRALPMIIDGIRARGFEIAPVYELLGKTKADVMAPLPASERWAARLDGAGFWLFDVGVAVSETVDTPHSAPARPASGRAPAGRASGRVHAAGGALARLRARRPCRRRRRRG